MYYVQCTKRLNSSDKFLLFLTMTRTSYFHFWTIFIFFVLNYESNKSTLLRSILFHLSCKQCRMIHMKLWSKLMQWYNLQLNKISVEPCKHKWIYFRFVTFTYITISQNRNPVRNTSKRIHILRNIFKLFMLFYSL